MEKKISMTPEAILGLIERFGRQLQAYRSGQYNETQLRREFLDPFWEALGWDVNNHQGYAEAYKDVIHEDAIKIGGVIKAPDYCFRIGGTRKFFVEAKKPSVNIKDDIVPAFQLRRYAWSARLPLSILTDFEEFAIYDCRVKPVKTDKAPTARILYLTYSDYLSRWDEIAAIFSRDAVLKGSFDAFAESNKGKKGTAEVDAAFLMEIEAWRELLAGHITLRNPQCTQRELNYSVQMILDRIIFLRICEDRGVEPYGGLAVLQSGTRVYQRLYELFRQADDRYNSGLFHFRQEKDRLDPPDDLTPRLMIDDKPIKEIISALYYPESSYEFSVLPADLLGQVYERFLGKVIRLTSGHRAVIEEKPQVKKAGGVFYTPTTIVDYIVKHTVGKLLEENSPKSGKNRVELRIIDPACGSGSFLLGAYQYFLDWYYKWYGDHQPEKWAKGRSPALYQAQKGAWRLTTAERKRILLKHIYGVDIDPQAVEVTKLSLLLKVLEGENAETLSRQLTMFRERALPDLAGNIKCGNSLIGPDFYDHQQMGLFSEEERYRINVFDWDAEFPEIMQAGGFDAVIGNPPYVRSITLRQSHPLLWDFCRSNYRTASAREWDIYLVFVEKGLTLLGKKGRLGYILPNKFLNSQVGENLRSLIAEGRHLEKLVHFGALQIFHAATTYTCLLFLNKGGTKGADVARYVGPLNIQESERIPPQEGSGFWTTSEISATDLTGNNWHFTASSGSLVQKLNRWQNLGSAAEVFQGTGTRADKVYLVEDRGREGELVRVFSREKQAEYLLEPTFLKPALRGRSIGRYRIDDESLILIVPYQAIAGKHVLMSQQRLAVTAPRTLQYLRECKPRLDERESGRFKGEGWYCFGRPQNLDRFEVPQKIVLPDVANRGTCFLDREGRWLLDTAYAIVPKSGLRFDLKFLLAILNSPLLTYFLKETGTPLRGGYFRMKTAYLNPFPVRAIDFSNPADAARHDRLVQLVQEMLSLQRQMGAAKTGHEKTNMQRQIDASDRQIDHLVYELYGLTEDEIKIVEGR